MASTASFIRSDVACRSRSIASVMTANKNESARIIPPVTPISSSRPFIDCGSQRLSGRPAEAQPDRFQVIKKQLHRELISKLDLAQLETLDDGERRSQVERVARRMLVETELPVGQIAETLGFEDVQHVARYFRAGKGLSPLAYRKTHGRKHAGQTRAETAGYV